MSEFFDFEGDDPQDRTDYLTILGMQTASSEDPELSEEDLETILDLSRRRDSNGLLPTEDGWTPTYDMNSAAAEGWRIKAGRASSRYTFAEDGQSFQRAQVYAHCIAQAGEFSRRIIGSIPTGPSTT